MDNSEFFHHMNLIKELMKDKSVRLILLHPPYTNIQQHIIDSICRNSKQIIGQLERTNPVDKTTQEMKRLIDSHKDPFIPSDDLKYVILGRQKPKINAFP